MPSSLNRWGGLAAMLAGALFVVEALWSPFTESHVGYHLPNFLLNAFLAMGVVGLYLYQSAHLGWLGRVGFYLTVTGATVAALGGLSVVLVEGVFGGTIPEALDGITHTLVLLVILGSLLFGIAIFRANVLPQGAALLVGLASLVTVALVLIGFDSPWLFLVPEALLGVGWAWLGYALWSQRGTAAQPSRVS
jgi:hypothetical protein